METRIKKMIKIQTIVLALLVCASFVVFAQDGQNAGAVAVEKEIILQAVESVQTAKATENVQKMEAEKEEQPREELHNAVEKNKDSKESSSYILKWMNDKSGDLVINILAGIILLVITPIILYFIGFFSFVIRSLAIWRNKLFCKDDFAQQLQKAKEEKQDAPLKENVSIEDKLEKDREYKEKLKNTYIDIQNFSFRNARSELWGDNHELKTGIFVICGKLFTGRQFFLEKELVNGHKADVFEVNEKKWLDVKHNEDTKEVREVLLERLVLLCRKWEIPVGGYTHKAVILLGESLTMKDLTKIVETLTETLKNQKGLFNSINHKKLTLIIKTNIRFPEEFQNQTTIPVEKLEFDQLKQDEALLFFKDNAWDEQQKKLLIAKLEVSPFLL